MQLFLRLFYASDVLEADGRAVAHEHAGAALAKAESLVAVALSLPHHEQQYRAEKDEWQEVDQDAEQAAQPACPLDIHPYRRGRGINAGGDEHFMHARARFLSRSVAVT